MMKNIPNKYYFILMFYQKIKFTKFKRLTKERCQEIDELVAQFWPFFHDDSSDFLNQCYNIVLYLITSYHKIGLKNGNEIYYFYIKMTDPSLVLLEIYETSNKREEIKNLAELNFGFYDPELLKLEIILNKHFNYYKFGELWDRDTLRR